MWRIRNPERKPRNPKRTRKKRKKEEERRRKEKTNEIKNTHITDPAIFWTIFGPLLNTRTRGE